MTTVDQCEAYAAEYQARGTAPDISIQRATALMSISQSWTTLAGQLDRLAQIIKDEDEEGGLVERLVRQLDGLVASGNTVVVVEHDMGIVAASDWDYRYWTRRRR